MRVLIVNAYSQTTEGKKAFAEFESAVRTVRLMQAFASGKLLPAAQVDFEIVSMRELDRYLYDPETPYTNPDSRKLFDHLDFIFVDGDANILPWFQRAEKLVTLIRMCKRTHKILFAAACGMQSFMYVYSYTQRITRVFNGSGKGGLIADARNLSREVLSRIRPGEVFLDNSTGDVYQYDPAAHEFYPLGNVGLHYHKAAEDNLIVREAMLIAVSSPPKAVVDPYPLFTGKLTETICRVSRQYVQHWLIRNLEAREFLVPQMNAWDVHPVNLTNKDSQVAVLAASGRGPLIVAYENTIGVQFHIATKYPSTITILSSFVKYHMTRYQNESDHFDIRLDELSYEFGPAANFVSLHRSRRKSSIEANAEAESGSAQVAMVRPCTGTTQASSRRPMTAGSLGVMATPAAAQAAASVLFRDNIRPKSAVRNSGFAFSKRFHDPLLVENNATTHSPIPLDASTLPNSGIYKTNSPHALLKAARASQLAIKGDFDKARTVELLKRMVGVRNTIEVGESRKVSETSASLDHSSEHSDNLLATFEFQSSSLVEQSENPGTWKTRTQIRELLHPGYPTNKMPKAQSRMPKSQSLSHISTKPCIKVAVAKIPFTAYRRETPTSLLHVKRGSSGPSVINDGAVYQDPATKRRREELEGRRKWVSEKNFTAFGKVSRPALDLLDLSGKFTWQHEFRETAKKRWVAGNFKV